MTLIRANGIDIDYTEQGEGSALILLRGLGTQRIQWPSSLLEGFASRGFRVITPDNRDAGLSQKFDGSVNAEEAVAARRRGEAPSVPSAYSLSDMAQDVVGLLDTLAIEKAHVVGISMGGAIVQHLAVHHGERLQSMTSVMSSSGAPGLPQATPEVLTALMSKPASNDRETVVAHTVRTDKVFASPGYPTPDDARYERARRCYDRCYCPEGTARQLTAIMSDVGYCERLASVQTPTLVIHGESDPLIPIECGRDTAERIPGARFHAIPGMGHDVPEGLVATLVELIADHAKRANP